MNFISNVLTWFFDGCFSLISSLTPNATSAAIWLLAALGCLVAFYPDDPTCSQTCEIQKFDVIVLPSQSCPPAAFRILDVGQFTSRAALAELLDTTKTITILRGYTDCQKSIDSTNCLSVWPVYVRIDDHWVGFRPSSLPADSTLTHLLCVQDSVVVYVGPLPSRVVPNVQD